MNSSPQINSRRLQLGTLIPAVILLCFIVDVALRFIPPERIAFSGLAAATVFATGDGPLAPNLTFRNVKAYGDLANMGNLSSLRHYRSDLFTTDQWGFRNTPNQSGMPVSVLFAGDSYTAGGSLSDSETLSAQVASMGHIGTYNAGDVHGDGSWPTIALLIKRLNLKNGLVVYQHSERYPVPGSADVPHSKAALASRLLPPNSKGYRAVRSAYHFIVGFSYYSPLQIMLTRSFLMLENDAQLPNVEGDNVIVKNLKDGSPFIFLPSEESNFGQMRDVNTVFFVKLNALVHSTGNELLVILVPDKYNVYYPLLQGVDESLDHGHSYLSALADNLNRAKIPVIDLTEPLREQAAAALLQGKYNYRPDDTHWNALGVSEAAKLILNSRHQLENVVAHK